MGKFREHGVMLFLDGELYLGFIKLQNDKKLGRAFAGLLPFTEGLFQMGCISEEVYEKHKEKYSKPLVVTKPKILSKKQLKAKEEKEQLNWTLGNVVDQWKIHLSKDWRGKWVNIAQQHPELENAIRVLALAKNEVLIE